MAFRDISKGELKALADRALAAADAEAGRIAQEFKARKPDPRSPADYKAYRTMSLFAVPVVKHSDRPRSIEISRDGNDIGKHAFLAPRRISIQPESSDQLLLILVPRGLAKWAAEAQSVNLFAVPPDLIGDWSDDDRKTWSHLKALASHINVRIHSAHHRRSLMTREQAA